MIIRGTFFKTFQYHVLLRIKAHATDPWCVIFHSQIVEDPCVLLCDTVSFSV